MATQFRQLFTAFLRNIFFWMFLFAFTRILYLLFNINFLKGIDLISILSVFLHALPLDISTACYLMALPFLLIIIQNIFPSKWSELLLKAYVFIIILIFCVITSVEMGIYSEWKTKLHYKALLYLAHPDEIIRTAQTWQLILLTLMVIIQVAGAFWIYNRFFFFKFHHNDRKIWASLVFLLLIPAFLFLGIRGGVQQIPINQSRAYFSRHEILNLASMNSGWNLVHSIVENAGLISKNPFLFYDPAYAKQTVQDLYKVKKDSTINILKTERPNIVMFILEGWSADLIESLGGEKGITPFFHQLEKEGVLFTNIYTSGGRSQQGMSSIFGGFPSHPLTTITQQSEKCIKLPSLSRTLGANGYYNSYYFGGDLTYGNILGYLLLNGFDKIEDEKDFPSSMPRGKLGIHDEYTLPYFLSELNTQKQPFFSNIFTVSTHSPYDMNMNEVHRWPAFEKNYVNAAYYSDACFAKFFTEARKQSWYKNTLFIFVSDHGHSSYRNWEMTSPEYNKIVFMMCGDAIKDSCKGMRIDKVGSQVDLASTLLNQLHIKDTAFFWSKNLLNTYCPEFAYYAFEEGLGYVRPGARYVYDAHWKEDKLLEIDSTANITREQLMIEGKSFLQSVFQQYMDF